MTLLAVESVRSTAHLAANATTLPVWTTVSRAFAVEVMLADAPLASLGLVGFALGACWTVIGGLGRYEPAFLRLIYLCRRVVLTDPSLIAEPSSASSLLPSLPSCRPSATSRRF